MAKRESAQAALMFVTGDANKLKEMRAIVGDTAKVDSIKLDLPQLQYATPEATSEAKVKLAFQQVGKPVLIEVTSLCFEALGGLPGPGVKWFYDKLGNEGLVKMLDAYPNNKRASALCIFAYWDGVMEAPILFTGSASGEIVMPVGSRGFGWDPIFKDTDSGLTWGEMDAEQKNAMSHRKKALDQLKDLSNSLCGEGVGQSKVNANYPHGLFVVFEGPDRAGKSTQIEILEEHFKNNGVPTVTMRDPDYSTPVVGSALQDHLNKIERLPEKYVRQLFAVGRRLNQAQLLEHLKGGKVVLYDRYAYCGIACGLAKTKSQNENVLGTNPEGWLKSLDKGLVKPDVVLYFKLRPEVAAQRADYGAQEYERLDFQQRYITEFDKHAQEWEFTQIDAEMEKDAVTSEIINVLENVNAPSAERKRLFASD